MDQTLWSQEENVAEVVGATSSEGFLVQFVHVALHRPFRAMKC